MNDVAVFGVGESLNVSNGSADGGELFFVDRFFDCVFDVVGELMPATREDLDAVVGGWVMAGRDHYAKVGVEVGG